MKSFQIQKTLSQFAKLKNTCIDSSSIIYLEKINLLNLVSNNLNLFTVPEVINEINSKRNKISILNCLTGENTDDKLINLSKQEQYPIISEDKYILKKAHKNEIVYFNTIMIVCFLLYKKIITKKEYAALSQKLKKIAFYSDFIWNYSEQVKQAVYKVY
jgi:hypothetical protein